MPPAPASPPLRRNSTPAREAPQAHPLDALPFVQPQADGPRRFWAPRPTGDYGYDTGLGQVYASALLPFIRAGETEILGLIVSEMVARGDVERDRGLIIGLCAALSRAIQAGRLTPR